jgi:hypothetical protein
MIVRVRSLDPRRPARLGLFREDAPRFIDKYIDYFGGDPPELSFRAGFSTDPAGLSGAHRPGYASGLRTRAAGCDFTRVQPCKFESQPGAQPPAPAERYQLGASEPGPFAGRPDAALVIQGVHDLMSMPSAGDLVIYGIDAPEGHVSYIPEVGAHAGPSPDPLPGGRVR